jgi:hypothetical protein
MTFANRGPDLPGRGFVLYRAPQAGTASVLNLRDTLYLSRMKPEIIPMPAARDACINSHFQWG